VQDTPLAEILPLQVGKAPLGLRQTTAGLAASGDLLPAESGADRLVCPWTHDLTATADARVLIRQGGAPWLAVRAAGRGRTLGCAGTLYGEAPAGKQLFWEWSGWVGWEAALLRWLAGK
jgi:hypothetical protein